MTVNQKQTDRIIEYVCDNFQYHVVGGRSSAYHPTCNLTFNYNLDAIIDWLISCLVDEMRRDY